MDLSDYSSLQGETHRFGSTSGAIIAALYSELRRAVGFGSEWNPETLRDSIQLRWLCVVEVPKRGRSCLEVEMQETRRQGESTIAAYAFSDSVTCSMPVLQ